jgi:hypothetical protein
MCSSYQFLSLLLAHLVRHVRMYVRMYVCMCVCVYMSTDIYAQSGLGRSSSLA